MSEIRRIKLPNLYNFRDLGGYQAEDGGLTKWNRLYRCDCPADLTENEWQQFSELGIKTLIDLRSTYEAMETPVKAPPSFRYIPCQFFREEEGAELTAEAGKKFLESLSLDYRVMTENATDRIALILRTILSSLSEGNTAFFCTAGKDRTGIIAAEILRLCGVCDEDIIADYSITEIYNEEVIRARLAAIPKEIMDQVSPETMAMAANSKAETMREYLAWSKEFGFSKVMNEEGFTFEMQRTLGKIMVTEEKTENR